MEYNIKNEFLSVTVSTKGAELMSIKNLKNDTEYLWQGDAKYWGSRASNLFPICGRLIEKEYTYRGKSYHLNTHGFARASEFELLQKGENTLSFVLRANDETRANYPFEFEYVVTYVLTDNTIKTIYSAKNLGKNKMYCAFGGHPGFTVPLGNDGVFEDYYLEFKQDTTQTEMLFKECFFTDETAPFKTENKRLYLRHDFFDNDAHFVIDSGFSCTLKSDKSDKSVIVTYPQMKYLGIWHAVKMDAPYICIEPWTSVPSYFGKVDDIETKRDMYALEANEEASVSFDITII